MRLKIFMQRASNLFAENRLLKFVVVVQSIAIVLGGFVVNSSRNNVRTVIQPPVINSKIEISGSWTSDAYVREYIRYIGALLWNYSPGTARNQFAEVLVSWHPSVYEEAKQRLYIMADQIEHTKAASVFYPYKIEHNHDRRVIEVSGNRHLTMQDKSIESSSKTYLVTYRAENGRFWITGVEEKGSGNRVGAAAELPKGPAQTNEGGR